MRASRLLMAALTIGLFLPQDNLGAQSASAALSGTVTSQEEGTMEGVLVTLRRDGANHTVTVVSNAEGRYSFPRSHVAAGEHAVAIRATGFDLTGTGRITTVDAASATLDLSLIWGGASGGYPGSLTYRGKSIWRPPWISHLYEGKHLEASEMA